MGIGTACEIHFWCKQEKEGEERMKKPAIGIVGGVGPAAGADLCHKIFSHTKVTCDQDHIDLYLTSCPSIIPDRTDFLLNHGADPRNGLLSCMEKLVALGATALGVACNTAHSQKIIGAIDMSFLGPDVRFCNMIEETCRFIADGYDEGVPIGFMATLGTTNTGVYDEYFSKYHGLKLVKCDEAYRKAINDAIYSKKYGIKVTPKVSDKARGILIDAVNQLKEKGCKAVILGCTELPLALDSENSPLPIIDPTDILAQALVRATEPEKLV
jgi:aspartate racemase